MFVQFFEYFGPSIASIDLSDCLFGADIMLDLVKKHCDNLEEIRCSASDELFTIAPNLRKLHIFKHFYPNLRGILRPSTSVINLLGLFPAHSKLQVLTVEDSGDATVILPDVRLRHLRDLRLKCVRLAHQPSTEQFFERNTQIETITFNALRSSFRQNLKDILKNSPSMRRLILYCDFRRMDDGLLRYFGFCGNLRTLKIWASTPLECIDHMRMTTSQILEPLLGRFPHQSNASDDGRHMLRIANSIANLTKFVFASQFLNFQQILYFVERTNDRLTSITLEIRKPFATETVLTSSTAIIGDIDEIVRKRGIGLSVVVRVQEYPELGQELVSRTNGLGISLGGVSR